MPLLTGLEYLAVALGLAYLLLAVRENPWCWACGAASTAIFFFLFLDAALYMQTLLQVYYLGMAAYGWNYWRTGATGHSRPIRSLSLRQQLALIGLILGLTLAARYVLVITTDARQPLLDAFTTWGSVVTTWMVARKYLENWLYWVVIDACCILLYWRSGLYATAGLFFLYTLIAAAGYLQWLKSFRTQSNLP